MGEQRVRTGETGSLRGQSHVVGVVVLLGLTAIAMGGLAATVGAIVESRTAQADAAGVADDFRTALQPVETTGHHAGVVAFGSGHLSTADRQLRVLDGGGVRQTVEVDALVFAAGQRRVAAVAGGVVRGAGASTWVERAPPITTGPDVLVVGAPRLNGTADRGGSAVTATIRTNVSHERRALGAGDYAVAIETRAPRAFAREADAPTSTRDIDGDGVESVVVDYAPRPEAYLVVHDLRLEVTDG